MFRILAVLLLSAVAFAQTTKLEGDPNPEPKFINAKLEYASAANGLKPVFDQAVQRAGAHWIGYSVPAVPKSRFICCFDSYDGWRQRNGCCSGCRLEREGGTFVNSDGGTCVNPEPVRAILVLFRAENGQVGKIRPYTPDCGLDAGNLPVIWIRDVKPRDSLALLEGFTKGASGDLDDGNDWDGKKSKRVANGALQAIALHADPEADRILERMLTANQPIGLRKQAAFWAGNERGRAGFEILKRIVPSDSDARFRREATFALSQSSEEHDAILELIAMAHKDSDTEVREQALFWLAQKASRQASKAITDAVENDPETRVRKKAVFALTQMPEDQGVPLLIKYAQSHKDPVVRKEAIFWLGQAKDPRALDFISQLLLSKK
jgi:HEAT repeat protein